MERAGTKWNDYKLLSDLLSVARVSVPALTTSSDSDHYFHWFLATELNQGSQPYDSSPSNFQLVGPDGSLLPNVSGADNSPSPIMTTSLMLRPNGGTLGWVGMYLPRRDGIYALVWRPNGETSSAVMAQLRVIAATNTVEMVSSAAPCVLPTATPAPTLVPTPVSPYPTSQSPPSGGGGTCIPKEGDDDNDDHGKPAAS